MKHKISKYNQFINEDKESVKSYLSSLGISLSGNLNMEEIEDILLDISDDVSENKYHWVETELKKLL